MAGIEALRTTLSARLEALAREHGVTGAVVAVQQGDEVVTASTGLTNVRTGVEVTPDTIFQIGSISKVYTATLVMQLVDEGLVDLDTAIATYLPGFAVADAAAGSSITVR